MLARLNRTTAPTAVVLIRVVTLNGRDHLLGSYGTAASRERYDRLIAEWLANGRRTECRRADSLTVSRVILEFWAHAKRYYANPDGSIGGEAENFRHALKPLRHLYGQTLAANFGPRSLVAVQHEMARLGWARTTINRQILRIKQVFKWAVAQELVPPSVYHGLLAVGGLRRGKSEARESKPVRPVPEEWVERTLHHVSPQVGAMFSCS
jgi:hypothetical protein